LRTRFHAACIVADTRMSSKAFSGIPISYGCPPVPVNGERQRRRGGLTCIKAWMSGMRYVGDRYMRGDLKWNMSI
jgi:hypothetical protein